MKTGRYITFIIAIAFAAVCASGRATAYKLPAKHTAAAKESSELMEGNAIVNVREKSPFADFKINEQGETKAQKDELNKITNYAAQFLGRRYRLGATGPSQFDCSGFVGYVYRNFGYNLHRDSRSQFTQGEKVDMKHLRPGDLLFFSSRSSGKGRVGHVGMVVDVNQDGSCTFIHASSSKKGVVYQKFPDNGYYSSKFVGAKRIVGSEGV